MTNKIDRLLVRADNICDYVPGVSTLTNTINGLAGGFFTLCKSEEYISKSHYLTHLKNKDLWMMVSIVPVPGNLAIGIRDFQNKKYNDKEYMLTIVQQNGLNLEYASEWISGDKDVVLVAVQQNGQALRHAFAPLRHDKGIVLAAVQQDGQALLFASAELRNDKDVVLAAVQQNGWAFKFASAELRNDKDVELAAVQQNGAVREYIDQSRKPRIISGGFSLLFPYVTFASVRQNGPFLAIDSW